MASSSSAPKLYMSDFLDTMPVQRKNGSAQPGHPTASGAQVAEPRAEAVAVEEHVVRRHVAVHQGGAQVACGGDVLVLQRRPRRG
jgi:hypothetical protein